MTQPLGHARDYMRLVSSQLTLPKLIPLDDSSFEQVRSFLAIKQYETARRAAIAFGRRNRFAIVQDHDDMMQSLFTEALAEVAKEHMP